MTPKNVERREVSEETEKTSVRTIQYLFDLSSSSIKHLLGDASQMIHIFLIAQKEKEEFQRFPYCKKFGLNVI